jgi:hypothetical protein
MPWKVDTVSRLHRAHAQRPAETKCPTRLVIERTRHQDGAVVVDGDKPAVEDGVEVRGEQKAVPDVEAFGVAVAGGPGLDVARAQQLGDGEASDGASALPQVQQALAEEVLAYALDDETLGLGGSGQRGSLLLEAVE